MPQVLVDAIIATEDSRFYMHNGLDVARFLKASASYVMGSNIGGASTLTMQISKNTFTSICFIRINIWIIFTRCLK